MYTEQRQVFTLPPVRAHQVYHYSEYTLDRSVVVKGTSVIFGIMSVIRE